MRVIIVAMIAIITIRVIIVMMRIAIRGVKRRKKGRKINVSLGSRDTIAIRVIQARVI